MPMPRLRSCCCGCSLRTGTLIILIYNLIFTLLLFCIELYIRITFFEVSALAVFIYIILIGSHILGIISVITKIYLLLLPFVILQLAYLVLLAVLGTMLAFFRDELVYRGVLFGNDLYEYWRIKQQNAKTVKNKPPQTPPPLTEEQLKASREWVLALVEKQHAPLKKYLLIGVAILASISFIMNLYFTVVVLSCLLEMREDEFLNAKRGPTDSDYD